MPAVSSVSQKVAADEQKRLAKEERMREGVDEDGAELSDMEVAELDGLVPVAVKVGFTRFFVISLTFTNGSGS